MLVATCIYTGAAWIYQYHISFDERRCTVLVLSVVFSDIGNRQSVAQRMGRFPVSVYAFAREDQCCIHFDMAGWCRLFSLPVHFRDGQAAAQIYEGIICQQLLLA